MKETVGITIKDTNALFADDLRDPAYAIGYLKIALEGDGVEGFRYALQKVACAHGILDIVAPPDTSFQHTPDKE